MVVVQALSVPVFYGTAGIGNGAVSGLKGVRGRHGYSTVSNNLHTLWYSRPVPWGRVGCRG